MVLQVSTGNPKLELLRLNCALLSKRHGLPKAMITRLPGGFQVHPPPGADLKEWAEMLRQGFGNVTLAPQ
jgi:hypothetical protein